MLKDELDAYLSDLSQHATEATVASHKVTLTQFVSEWRDQDVTTDELSEELAAEFLATTSTEYAKETVRGKISTLTNFIAYIQSKDRGVIRCEIRSKLSQRNPDLDITPGPGSADTPTIECLQVSFNGYLDYLRNRKYGTRVHAISEIAAATGTRLKQIPKLDLEDLQSDAQSLELGVSHGSVINGGESTSTWTVTLPADCARVVTTYLDYERIPVEKEDDAEPLFTTQHGRLSVATLRRSIQQAMTDAASSGTASDEATRILLSEQDDSARLSPRHIRWYYIVQQIEE